MRTPTLTSMAVAVAVAAVTVVGPSAATAAPPEPGGFDVLVEGTCAFPVAVTVTGRSKTIEHGTVTIATAPGMRATLTNTETRETITINLGGALHERMLADGTTVGWGTGHNLFSGGGLEGLIYTTGRADYTYDPIADTLDLQPTRGRASDLCESLA